MASRERPQPDLRHGPVREAGQLRAVQPPWFRPAACTGPGWGRLNSYPLSTGSHPKKPAAAHQQATLAQES
jgi:hypothetical protein